MLASDAPVVALFVVVDENVVEIVALAVIEEVHLAATILPLSRKRVNITVERGIGSTPYPIQ